MHLNIQQATPVQTALAAAILSEAAEWLRSCGCPLWDSHHVAFDHVEAGVQAGHFFIAHANGEAAGVIKLLLADPEFWPEITNGSSAFIHRLAVRRRFAGTGVSAALVQFAAGHAVSMGRKFLRLDCPDDRPRLRAVYERLGFKLHSIFDAGAFCVARYELKLT